MGHHIYSKGKRIKQARKTRKIMNAKHHKYDGERNRIELEMLKRSCTYGLTLIKSEKKCPEYLVTIPKALPL